jgi:hypothetical protein
MGSTTAAGKGRSPSPGPIKIPVVHHPGLDAPGAPGLRLCHLPDASVIRELHLFGIPVAVNMDQEPGPDGFALRVYASNGRAATGIPIKAGRLEIVMTDGGKPKAGEEPKPLKVWTYDAVALKAHAVKSSIGWGYRFGLAWNEARPTHEPLHRNGSLCFPFRRGARFFSQRAFHDAAMMTACHARCSC